MRYLYLLIILLTQNVFASKIEFSTGYFFLKVLASTSTDAAATTTTTSSAGAGARDLANISTYRLGFATELDYNLDFSLGFGFLTSAFLSGDFAYGLDFGLRYYPFTDSGTTRSAFSGTTMTVTNTWRPFIGGDISSRIFQTSKSASSYFGPGFTLGTMYAFNTSWSMSGEFRYNYYIGSNKRSAMDFNALVGVVYDF